jgi:hypothetical protein
MAGTVVMAALPCSVFAQDLGATSVPMGQLGLWIIIMGVVLSIVSSLVAIFQAFRRQPPIDAEFATKREVGSLRAEVCAQMENFGGSIERLRLEIKSDINNLDQQISARTRGTHNRIDAVLADVSNLRGQIEVMTKPELSRRPK